MNPDDLRQAIEGFEADTGQIAGRLRDMLDAAEHDGEEE